MLRELAKQQKREAELGANLMLELEENDNEDRESSQQDDSPSDALRPTSAGKHVVMKPHDV